MEDNTIHGKLTEDESLQTQTMLASLSQYDLDEDDFSLLETERATDSSHFEMENFPILAVIGRPNVGKSTLVNRILGRREAIVQDLPGVTRDRVIHRAEWAGRDFYVIDTGGWEVDTVGLAREVAAQAEIAVKQADAVVFVVDANVGPTASDERVVELLRRAGKPVVLAANKVDAAAQEADAASLWGLGLGEPVPVSALHGRGTGDLLDVILRKLPKVTGQNEIPSSEGMRRVALIGKPNVGKSSLLNALLGENRAVVHDQAGTTRDPVDEVVKLDGRMWNFIDTAGVKRRSHRIQGADYYASLRTQTALERAEVGLVLIDASIPLSEQDVRVVQQVVDAGRALVIANNKWDLVDEDRRHELARERDRELASVSWAPQINLSALTTWHVNRIPRALESALAGWEQRIPTGRLNAFFGRLIAANPHPVRGGKQPRILFATQADTKPPRFVLFTTGFLEPTYRRFIERKLREEFGFEGTPIQLSMRVRERKRPR